MHGSPGAHDNGRMRRAALVAHQTVERLHEERELKLAALKVALAEGRASGLVEFSFEELSKELDAMPRQ